MIQGYEYSETGARGDTDSPSSFHATRQLFPKPAESPGEMLSRSATAAFKASTSGPAARSTLPTAELRLGSAVLTGSVPCAPAPRVRLRRTRPGGFPAPP